jgi:ribosome maturation factor RimP
MIAEKIIEHIKAPIENLDYIFWGIEIESRSKGKGILARIYIDHEDGISVDDCQKVSKHIAVILDVEDVIPSEYILEVSSPGADRRVFTLEQANMLLGFKFKIKLYQSVNKSKNYKVTLDSIRDNILTFVIDSGDQIQVDFHNIEKMRVIPQW